MKKSNVYGALILALFLLLSACTGGGTKVEDAGEQKKEASTEDRKEGAGVAKDAKNPETPEVRKPVVLEYRSEYKEMVRKYRPQYDATLKAYYSLILNSSQADAVSDDMIAVHHVLSGDDSDLWKVGYNVIDLSGDGIPELIIGAIEEGRLAPTYGSAIYALYTLKDGKVEYLGGGLDRDGLFYIGDSKFYHERLGHPIDEVAGTYVLNVDGSKFTTLDYYFSAPKKDNPAEFTYYYNKGGEPDPAKSEEVVSEERNFERFLNENNENIKSILLLPMGNYRHDSFEDLNFIQVVADFSTEEELAYVFDYDSYNAQDEEAIRVTFTSNEAAKDFKLLSMTFHGIDENGEGIFSAEEVYAMDVLDPNRPFIAGLQLLGSIPNNGFSYTDENGMTRTFLLYESGKDGSLLTDEINMGKG